ncbi:MULTISPECIES: phosphoadenylyl-sulfate reductase [Fictibacillus]|uniref:Adenosine 5'-phosphosulfate reductase n=1 Tax=Fictibacillus enclensis TaxID=1017270 RepID=A0A0V8J8F5_9BACL|nr:MULTISPECIES: phosphoadenylyl-sulfate reductase [Fictibacillus]KSU83299.1 phosphoadenosine phosphosulfate reductase [Fictibacillus enclensis]RXZ02046.1 phosphoadenylyl-sulfate reductase [Fictibacillus sp. S7]SCC13195.1 phosphoadenosine phosphosulfate reductase [Fictibacillus enclensis]
MLKYDTWEEQEHDFPFPSDSETKGAMEVLQWAYDYYGDELVYACSFGIEGSVLVDLISKVKPDARVVFLDTGLHFKETYEVIEKAKEKYPSLNIEMKKPALSVAEQAGEHGDELWKRNPNLCCQIRKVIPLEETLSGASAWLSGLRREQSETRRNTQYVNKDNRFKSIKICPLIHWTYKDIWRYAHKHSLPYNTLHDQGYPSIGCQPCTLPADWASGDARSGRWSGQGKTECGLHQ